MSKPKPGRRTATMTISLRKELKPLIERRCEALVRSKSSYINSLIVEDLETANKR